MKLFNSGGTCMVNEIILENYKIMKEYNSLDLNVSYAGLITTDNRFSNIWDCFTKHGGYDNSDLKPNKLKLISYCPDVINKFRYTSYIFAMSNMTIYSDTILGEVKLLSVDQRSRYTRTISRPIYFVLLFENKENLVKSRLMLDITNVIEI